MYFQKINQRAANLWIEGMEAPLWEIEQIASCTHQQGSNQCQALPSEDLGIAIENSWNNMICKEAQVPVQCVNLQVHTGTYLVHTYTY